MERSRPFVLLGAASLALAIAVRWDRRVCFTPAPAPSARVTPCTSHQRRVNKPKIHTHPALLLITWSIDFCDIIFGCCLCAPYFLWLNFWGMHPACVTLEYFLSSATDKPTSELRLRYESASHSQGTRLAENCLYLSWCNMFPLWYFERKHSAVVRRDVELLTRWRWPDSL